MKKLQEIYGEDNYKIAELFANRLERKFIENVRDVVIKLDKPIYFNKPYDEIKVLKVFKKVSKNKYKPVKIQSGFELVNYMRIFTSDYNILGIIDISGISDTKRRFRLIYSFRNDLLLAIKFPIPWRIK